MSGVFKTVLIEWNEKTTERQKLQHVYALVAVAALMIAGVTSLVNYSLGQKLLLIVVLALLVLAVNMMTWALLQSFLLMRLAQNKANTKLKAKSSLKKK